MSRRLQSNDRLECLSAIAISRFEDLPTAFSAVATDLQTGAAVIMRDTGDVAFAIRRAAPFLVGMYR
jgi:NTE family protein